TTSRSVHESSLIHGQKKGKFAAVGGFALYPDLPAMRLHQAFGNREAQAHAGSIAIHADEVLENFLVMFGCDSGSGIRDGYFHAVRARQTETPAFLGRRGFGNAALPEMRERPERDGSTGGSMFQRIVQKIGRCLLHLLIVEAEVRN